MRCHEFEQQLQLNLDSRQGNMLTAAQAEHAAHCESCRRQALDFQQLVSALRPASSWKAPPALAQQIVAEVLKGRFADMDELEETEANHAVAPSPPLYDVAPRRMSGWMLGLLALSAVMLMGVGIAIVGQGKKEQSGPALVNSQPVPTTKTPAVNELQIVKSPPIAPSAVIPQETELGANTETTSWEYSTAIASLPKDIPDAVSKLEEVEEYAPGFRPIRASFSTAIDTLKRTWPVGKETHMVPRPDTGFAPFSRPFSA
ncbi:MAG: anti-sigma factor family protein [Planctomycetaceae bacterium]